MIKKITFVFALFVALSGTSFADTAFSGVDGADDLIEAYGGTRNGGDC